MPRKLFSNIREARPIVDADQIGLLLWVMAVLVIGLGLVVRITKQPAILQII